jgi:hypothetical protein
MSNISSAASILYGQSSTLLEGFGFNTSSGNAGAGSGGAPHFVANATPSDTIDLSQHAQDILAQADASQSVAADLQLTPEQRLQKRVDAFASKLSDFFTSNFIPLSEKTVFNVNAYGDIQVDGAYKKKLDQYFKDHPDDAKELKTITKLSALQATQKALDLYVQEKKAAKGDKKLENAAADRYAVRSQHINDISGTITFENGKLTSAATEYADELTHPEKAKQQTN